MIQGFNQFFRRQGFTNSRKALDIGKQYRALADFAFAGNRALFRLDYLLRDFFGTKRDKSRAALPSMTDSTSRFSGTVQGKRQHAGYH